MPTLGLWKKKRTKDSGHKDPNSPSSPIGNSPITPTTTGGFQESLASTSSHTLSSQSQNSSSKGAQRPPSSGVPHQQPASSTLRSPGHDPLVNTSQQDAPKTTNAISSPQNEEPSNMENSGIGLGVAANPDARITNTQPRTTKGKYSLTDFALQRTLGTGSFGRVHLVQSKHNQRFYAIKVLKKAQVVRMKQVEHTNDERRMLQKVKHAFLVTLWGTFQDSKNLYMVMDFIEGGELFSLLRKSQVSGIGFHDCYYQFYTIFEYKDSLET